MSRWSLSSKPKCEQQYRIDLTWLRRNGGLVVGRAGPIAWSLRGETSGSINYQILEHGLRLMYRTRHNGSEWRDIDQYIPFTRSDAAFGGRRLWFECPDCHRRCQVVYGGAVFSCRKCYGLTYSSQYEASYQRAIDQADKLRTRVGGGRGAFDEEPFPPKPKGMHWRTYERLEDRYNELMNAWAAGVMQRFGIGR